MLNNYTTDSFYDEMFTSPGSHRNFYSSVKNSIERLGADTLNARRKAAEKVLRTMGITFTLHND